MEGILHQLIGSLSHYLQGFIHPRWCRISSINSTLPETNIFEPKNGWLEYDCFLLGWLNFEVRTVSFRECKTLEFVVLNLHPHLVVENWKSTSMFEEKFEVKQLWCHLCQGLNSHYFHIIGDGHQPNSRGLYTHYKDSY